MITESEVHSYKNGEFRNYYSGRKLVGEGGGGRGVKEGICLVYIRALRPSLNRNGGGTIGIVHLCGITQSPDISVVPASRNSHSATDYIVKRVTVAIESFNSERF